MTQEHKELLIKDLCARLPYGPMVDFNGIRITLHNMKVFQLYDGDNIKDHMCLIDIFGDDDYVDVENIKPYLFPLSSMTEEQYYELQNCSSEDCLEHMELVKTLRDYTNFTHWPLYSYRVIDWFHKNHFDYRGLIPMGLAKDATGLNIYY